LLKEPAEILKGVLSVLAIVRGSCYEVETQVIVSEKLGLISKEASEMIYARLTEVQKMNYNLK